MDWMAAKTDVCKPASLSAGVTAAPPACVRKQCKHCGWLRLD